MARDAQIVQIGNAAGNTNLIAVHRGGTSHELSYTLPSSTRIGGSFSRDLTDEDGAMRSLQ